MSNGCDGPGRFRAWKCGATPGKRLLFAGALIGTGLLSLGVVPLEELKSTKPQLKTSWSGDNLIIDWAAHPEVFYFMEGTADLKDGPWVTAKLLKDNDASGSLSLGATVSGSKAFFRLILEGDPGAARLRADSDGDGISNLLEAEAGWDAYVSEDPTDGDADGVPDYFELFHFETLNHDGSYAAIAGGLTLAEAYASGTDPNSVDSDGDGWTDEREIDWGWDPNYDQSRDDPKYGFLGDYDSDSLTNEVEADLDLNPSEKDTDKNNVEDGQEDSDGDNIVNVNDAVPNDIEINWEKTQESRYVWIPQVRKTGASKVSRHGHILFPGDRSAASETVWDSKTSSYLSIIENSLWTGSGLLKEIEHEEEDENGSTTYRFTYDPVDFNPAYDEICDMNDDGTLVGFSNWHAFETPGSIMKWEISESTNQYGSPIYFLPSVHYYEYYSNWPLDADRRRLSKVMAPGSWDNSPKIADDGAVAGVAETSPDHETLWVSAQSNEHCSEMSVWKTIDLVASSLVTPQRAGAILDHETGLFIDRFKVPSNDTALHYKSGEELDDLEPMFTMDSYSDVQTDISRTPVPEGATTGRVWFSVNHYGGDAVFLEKSDGGSGVSRWHEPASMGEGAIRLNALGEAITATKVWRNGTYTPINDLVGKPDGSDLNITKLIDVASNGIILAEATEGGVTKTGLLLKMDIDIHQPGKVAKHVVGTLDTYELPPEIPEAEQQDPTRCPVLVNDDNDDLDWVTNSPYPKDNDDTVLNLSRPGAGATKDLDDPAIMNWYKPSELLNDDDVVMVTLRKFDGIDTGKIKLTTSNNSDVQIFKYAEGEYELDAVDFNELVVDLSNPGTTSPLKDLPNGDVSFYIEGMADNSDLTVQMIFEDANDNELARQEVHLEIQPTREINLTVLPHGSLSDITISKELTRMIQGANRVREDKDGQDIDNDNASPVVFRLGGLLPKDTLGSHSSWDSISQTQRSQVLQYIAQPETTADFYLTDVINGAGGYAHLNSKKFAVAVTGSRDVVVAHEWLHAFAGSEHDVCVDQNIMINDQEDPCPNGAGRGTDTSVDDVSNLQLK